MSVKSTFCLLVFVLTMLGYAMPSMGTGINPGVSLEPKIPVLTRLVSEFYTLETRLIEATKANDRATIYSLVDEDFELRAGPSPAVPTPREDWLQKSLNKESTHYAIEQMAVHDLGKTAIVSYLGRRQSDGNLFFVDVWIKKTGSWKLAIRYLSPSTSSANNLPGWDENAQVIDKRY